ncbi:MAG TPA: PilZ domain-containing protein [Planctomycetota bacterium]|nr:PilZ domain-containing protein [Planctomycetota bacterium]
MADEKRRYPRINSLNIVADRGRVFRTLDLSREGMLLEMDFPAALGTRLALDVALGESVVEVQGLVVRHVPQDNGRIAVGIRFDRVTPRVERTLREFLLKKSE